MNHESQRLQFIGRGTSQNLGRAATYFNELAREAHVSGDVIAHLDARIRSARTELEKCLEGHDSFDALSFLRLVAGPWDFTGLKESETVLETSQAVQDVVALAFLSMGLPRTPLTGENSGQPDIGKAVKCAAEIVRAASARALIQGGRLKEPLGDLAGKFLSYELVVRGRQYASVATELNTDLLLVGAARTSVESVLGFNLEEIRAIREAAVALLNERFFGARDRIGDAVQAGIDPEDVDRKAFLRDVNLMFNECRLFGAVTVADVAARCGVDETRARKVLGFFSRTRPSDDAIDPITAFARGDRSAAGGCIADGGDYLILNGFLGEDELRRSVERGLVAACQRGGSAARAWEKYARHRAAFSELKASAALTALLGGAAPAWRGQKYLGPDSVSDVALLAAEADLTTIRVREFESDLLFVVDGVAFCVEVKAGSVTDKARGGNAKRLATDLEKTLKEGNEQADRLAELLRLNRGVWTSDGRWIELPAVVEVHSIIVMLDDMGPLSLSMNQLAERGVITTEEVPWIVSVHDLLVISRTIDHPAQFLEYVRRRRGRKLATMVSGADELDVFMWFLDGGMYFEQDPQDVAAQLPVEKPAKRGDQRRYELQPKVHLGTLTDPLDAWFYGEEGFSQIRAPKPTRSEERWVEDYLSASETAGSPGWLRFGADLVGLGGSGQRAIGRELRSQCRNARGGDRERSLTTHGTSSTGSWLLTAAAVPDGAPIAHLPEYLDAKQYQTRASRSMLLLYGTNGRLTGSRYRGEPEPRTPQRDAAIAVAPLRSLATTFRSIPPSARRSTKQLRGKRTRKKHR